MNRFTSALAIASSFGLSLLLVASPTHAQDDREVTTEVVVTSPYATMEHIHGPAHEFARICCRVEQSRNVHLRDIEAGVRDLSNRGPEMNAYLINLVSEMAHGRRDWVFWSVACGALNNAGPDGQNALRSLASNRSADPWARLAARQALDGRFQ